MCKHSGIVLALWFNASGAQLGEGVKTCRRVLSTSNGCVRSAATMPESAPDVNEIPMGESETRDWFEERRDLSSSKPAQ